MKVENNENINKVLGLSPIESATELLPLQDNQETLPDVSNQRTADEIQHIQDIEMAKKNVKDIIAQGTNILGELQSLASQSESPRAFEVLSGMMKTILEANKDFVDLSQTEKYAKQESAKEPETTNITNNNLIISTSDLLKQLSSGNND